jgi:tRNA 2-thiocytidine biosynthesis protein TtcA
MSVGKRAHKYLFKQLSSTAAKYELFEPGDRVAVALSGGKDSYTLLLLLQQLVRTLTFPVELFVLHLDQGQPGYDGLPLRQWLTERHITHEILREDTYSVVVEHTKPGGTYCSVCSRLRRGVLYTAMERLGLNKLALGHHRDDTLETLLLNLLYAGKLQAMPARYTTDDGRFQVIRPLIECSEQTIVEFAQAQRFPILPCNLCGSQEGLKRARIRELITQLEGDNPNVRSVMLNALTNVRPTHLLDTDVLAAWQTRAAHVRPDPVPKATTRHMQALPVPASSLVRRLPVISD